MKSLIANRNFIFLIPLCVILGIDSERGVFFVIFLFFIAYYLISNFSNAEDKNFLIKFLVWGFLIHFIVLYFSHVTLMLFRDNDGVFFRDEHDNILRGWLMSKLAVSDNYLNGERILVWNGNEYSMSKNFKFGLYNQHLYSYFLFFWTYIFGPSVFAIKLLNSLVGVITAIIGYFLSKKWFGNPTAKFAGILICFYPTLFLWSITALKESFFIMIMLLTFYIFYLLVKTKKPIYIVGLFCAIYTLYLLRYRSYFFELFYVFLLFYLLSLLLKQRMLTKTIVFLSLSFLVFFTLQIKDLSVTTLFKTETLRFFNYHSNVLSSGGITYKILDEKFYTPSLNISDWTFLVQIKYIIFSLLYFFSLPHFWHIQSKIQLFFYPFIFLWWGILIFFIVGVILSKKRRDAAIDYSFIITLLIVLFLGLTGGNIGTLVRHRDMITPIILSFAAYGLVRFFNIDKRRIFSK